MKVKIYPILSSLHTDFVSKTTADLLNELKDENIEIELVKDIPSLYLDANLSLILVQSGGSENLFLENFSKFKAPYYFLTYGSNNSLAASLEILAFLKKYNLDGEILHGNSSYLKSRINELVNKENYTVKSNNRLGVIGLPSDWLISSNVDYKLVQEKFDISLIDISIAEVEEEYFKIGDDFKIEEKFKSSFDNIELRKAYRFYLALSNIISKYKLYGFTIRCFDLLNKLKTTACLGLSLFNSKKIVATCEGDIPSLISMYIARKLLNLESFQANPSQIDLSNNQILLAHCTLPLNMCKTYKFDTHFESQIGLGIHGELDLDDVTIFRINSNLSKYFVTEGKIVKNLYKSNLCRTQILVDATNLNKLLTYPLGNHLIVIYKKHKDELEKYFASKNMTAVI